MTRPCSYRNSRQGPRRLAFGSLICGNGQISKIENERDGSRWLRGAVRRVWASVRYDPGAAGRSIANRAYIRTCKIMLTMNRTASVFIRNSRIPVEGGPKASTCTIHTRRDKSLDMS